MKKSPPKTTQAKYLSIAKRQHWRPRPMTKNRKILPGAAIYLPSHKTAVVTRVQADPQCGSALVHYRYEDGEVGVIREWRIVSVIQANGLHLVSSKDK